MLDATSNARNVVSNNPFRHHLNESSHVYQPSSYQAVTAGVVPPFSQHIGGSHPAAGLQQNPSPNGANSLSHTVQTMNPHNGCVLPQLSHGLSNASQSLAAALFATSPLMNDNLKLAAAAAAAVAQSRGKKSHRAEPVPQSGFKGVSWNSRMKAWLAFYVTENGERKSKTFSTRKLGMEEARLQAIAFCKQKQDQRREARKRSRGLQNQRGNSGGIIGRNGSDVTNALDRFSSDESILESPNTLQDQHHVPLRCNYSTTTGMGCNASSALMTPASGSTGNTSVSTNSAQMSNTTSSNSDIAYIPIVPIALEMIEKSGVLQPLELNVLPPCQHCNKQPYPFLLIVSEGQEQAYNRNSIITLPSTHQAPTASPASESPINGSTVTTPPVVVPNTHVLSKDNSHNIPNTHNSPSSDTEGPESSLLLSPLLARQFTSSCNTLNRYSGVSDNSNQLNSFVDSKQSSLFQLAGAHNAHVSSSTSSSNVVLKGPPTTSQQLNCGASLWGTGNNAPLSSSASTIHREVVTPPHLSDCTASYALG